MCVCVCVCMCVCVCVCTYIHTYIHVHMIYIYIHIYIYIFTGSAFTARWRNSDAFGQLSRFRKICAIAVSVCTCFVFVQK